MSSLSQTLYFMTLLTTFWRCPATVSVTRTLLGQSSQILSANTNVMIAMERPVQTADGPVIYPTTPAEQGYIHFYSSVLKFNDSDYRLYYFSKGELGYLTHVALAENPIGPWTKPNLGLISVANSTRNNVVSRGNILVTVFIDDRPDVSQAEKIKAIIPAAHTTSQIIYSPDGFRWPANSGGSGGGGVGPSIGWVDMHDTQPVVFWDSVTSQYIAAGRIDNRNYSTLPTCMSHPYTGAPVAEGARSTRYIGVATSATLSDGAFSIPRNVLNRSEGDSACLDLYTSQLVRYEDLLLAFPSAYYHFPSGDPPNAPNGSAGRGNDGVLSIRLAYSADDGNTFQYVGVPPGTAPEQEWITRGAGEFSPSRWRFEGDWDAGHVFMTRGLLQASLSDLKGGAKHNKHEDDPSEWDTIVAYHHGSQLTHGGIDKWWVPNYHNITANDPIHSGIGQVQLRRDGFASLRLAPNVEAANVSMNQITIPKCDVGEDSYLLVNANVGVNGGLKVGLDTQMDGYSLEDADYLVGNSVRQPVTWSQGQIKTLTKLMGQSVSVVFHIVHDVKLYAYEIRCRAPAK